MAYTKKIWINGVTDTMAEAMNNIENGIYNNDIQISGMTNIVNKEKDVLAWKQVITNNNLDNMIMDTLLDISNINTSLSTGYIYQEYALMTASTATIVWNVYASETEINNVYIVVDAILGTGSITYSVSRDGGTTWTSVLPNTLTNISSQPEGKDIVLKAIITANPIINAIGWGWN